MSLDSSSFLWWFASSGGGRAFRYFGLGKFSKHASLALFLQAIALKPLPFKGYLTSAVAAHTNLPKSKYRRRRPLLPPFHPQAACKVVPAFFRSVPPKSDVATPYPKAHCWLVRAVHEDDGSRVTVCGHSYVSERLRTTSLLPGVQV